MNKDIKLEVGKPAPDFCLVDQDGGKVCLQDFSGKWLVLYFYPKDNTSGCTLEAIDFSGQLAEFQALNAVVIGVSPDSVKSHQKFIDKHQLRIILLSDENHEVLQKYGVWQIKKMYGKEYYGVVRSTFLIAPDGKLAAIWDKVAVKDHANQVRARLMELQK